MSGERLLSIGEQIRLGKNCLKVEGVDVERHINTAAYFLGEQQIRLGLPSDSIANWCVTEGEICLPKAKEITQGK